MNRILFASLMLIAGALCGGAVLAQAPKVPILADDKGAVYVEPNVQSTETSAETKGATVGVQRPDGSGAYGGVDTSGTKPAYSVGASTGGNVSFSAGTTTDGKKESTGVKAGVTIKY